MLSQLSYIVGGVVGFVSIFTTKRMRPTLLIVRKTATLSEKRTKRQNVLWLCRSITELGLRRSNAPSSKMEPQITDEQLLEHVRSKLKTKGATGEAITNRLLALGQVLDYSCLAAMLRDPDGAWPRLVTHFRSPFAFQQHVGAAITALKLLGASKMNSPASPDYKLLLGKWALRFNELSARCKEQESALTGMFSSAAGVSAPTIAGYMQNLVQMLALLNVSDIVTVVSNPGRFRLELCRACKDNNKSQYTESTYISRILSLFRHNQRLQQVHGAAFEVWSRAASEHRARHMQVARQNAPTNASQVRNYTPLAEWQAAFDKLQHSPGAHDTLAKSQALVLFAYACTMPPKRAEMGAVRIFLTRPDDPADLAPFPNHIIVSESVLRLTRHKTSKHEAHQGGITELLSPGFLAILTESLARQPRDYLFVDRNGRPFTNQGFSKFVTRTTKHTFGGDKAPGVSLLRHAFCALDYNTLTGQERADLALRMGHISPMQDVYRFLRLDVHTVRPPTHFD